MEDPALPALKAALPVSPQPIAQDAHHQLTYLVAAAIIAKTSWWVVKRVQTIQHA